LVDLDLGQLLTEAVSVPPSFQRTDPVDLSPYLLESFDAIHAAKTEVVAEAGSTVLSLRVFIIPARRDRQAAFDFLSLMESQEGVIPFDFPQVGEASTSRDNLDSHTIVFLRCEALAEVTASSSPEGMAFADVVEIILAVDAKLSEAACP
jgi:hypothetical protein